MIEIESLLTNGYFIAICILIFVLIVVKIPDTYNNSHEGFIQTSPFIAKSDNDIYDTFYATVYDTLHDPSTRSKADYSKIVELTRPSRSNSVFLDIGSGTGHLVNRLEQNGYSVYGIDKSPAMVKQSLTKYPDIDVKSGDVLDPTTYDHGMFTHITCMDQTIYHIEDKHMFFRNCYNWLMPNGFLILHLIDKGESVKDKMVEFVDFKYNRKHERKDDGRVVVKEQFVDDILKNVRQNELTLYMDPLSRIVKMALDNGFVAHAQVNVQGDDSQYIYVFERLL